jgi:hypothetical protein
MRKTVVEPVFGQIKQARSFRQFFLRGLGKVQGEWAMICLTHNILKLHRLCFGPLDGREQERPLIKVIATLEKPSYGRCCDLHGANSDLLFSQLGSCSLQRLSNSILGRAARAREFSQGKTGSYQT